MAFNLHLLHVTDQEGAAPALVNAPNTSAVLNALDAQYDNTLRLSAGDLWLPGLFYTASEEVYGVPGIGDILINNALGIQAAAFGNHEFDQGTEAIRALLEANFEIVGPGIGPDGYTGTLFPYLSSNLDFTNDPNLADLVVADGLEASTIPNGIAKSTVVTVGEELIGIVGATTPTLRRISSPGPNVGINPADPNDFDALAAIIQESVDDLIDANPGLNKVILMAHTQVLGIEVNELAPRLRHVDIIIGGGSDSILANPENRLRDGDEAVDVYPIIQRDADNNPVAIVATDGQYLYIGQLLVTFDANGIIDVNSIDPAISGAYATDAAGVAALGAEDLVDPVVAEVIAALTGVVAEKERNLFGITEVFLNARRAGGGLDGVRNQETNLGNLTADANLWYGKQVDPTVQISIKNGGGIRESIGAVTTLAGETEPTRIAPEAAELFGKPAGGITQTDIESVLAFNNRLSLVTVTAAELLEILEHTVGLASSATPDTEIGSFAHVGGIAYSFDPTLPARQADLDGNQTIPGQRIRSVALLDDEGNVAEVLVENGEVQVDPDRTFRTITLDFLANGGSGYPIPQRERIDLAAEGVITVEQITVGDFEIGFDASRVSDTTSGLFVADTVSGLGTLFDISTLSLEQFEAGEGTFSVGPADLLLSSELATVLNLPDLAGADVGDTRIDALIVPTDTESLFSVVGGTTSVFLDRNAFRFGAMLNLTGAEGGAPFSDNFQVGFEITEATGATVLLGANGGIAGFEGTLAHSGSVTFNQEYASFAAPGGEQDAFAEYLAAFFSPLAETGFNQEDTPRELDSRIQNLTFRSDTVIDPVGTVDPTPVVPSLLVPRGTYETGIFDESAAEIVVHDPVTQRLFVVNASAPSVDVLDISDPSNLILVRSIDPSEFGAEVNSVAVANGIVAVAVEAEEKTDPGKVVFYDVDGNFLKVVTVGAQPDMLTFTPDGSKVLVANEGEPNDDYTIDPEGSVSIINLSGGIANLTQANVTTADFTAFNDQRDALIASGVRIFGPNATVAQDVEPEYIVVTSDSSTAYVALQENNALAVVDIASSTVTKILPLGFQDHSVVPLDASDRDGAINITTYSNLFGIRMPDGIAIYEAGGESFIVTANEGDARDYDGFSEEERVKDLILDPDAFPDAYELQKDENLGRLTVTTANGLSDGVFFKADLTGDQEVGPVETSAEGSAVLKLNEDRTALSYTITVEGLDFGPILGLDSQTPDTDDDDVTLLHFHAAPAGANGPVVFGIFGPNQDPDVMATINEDGSTTLTGTWSEADPASEPLSAFIPALLETEIGDEVSLYLNLHTVGNPGGEIRGQLESTLAYEELYSYGARSFSIFDGEGNLVYDSGAQFEQIIAERFPDNFNTNHVVNDFDNRSDNKGPEPEGVAIGEIDGRTYAFIGLERFGGVMTYDITNPAESFFVDLVNNRDFSGDPEAGTAGDLGAEGVIFISEADSPNGKPLVVVGNEVSGTTTVFDASALRSAPDTFLDLRNLTGDVDVSFTVNREAAFDNFVGFYRVTDINGGIDLTGDGLANVNPGQSGYTIAALGARAMDVALTTPNLTESVFESTVAGGNLYAPFLIANGDLDRFNSQNVYFAFGAANADGVEHIRFNNGALEFEDLFGGGDRDFNDMVVKFAV